MPEISSLTVAGTTFSLPSIPTNISAFTNDVGYTTNTGTVTGTGTNTYLAKWNDSSTITNGPKITSGNTDYFLREDGNWRYPQTLGDNYPPAYTLTMQNDGNLVMYNQSTGDAVWQTGVVGGTPGARVRPLSMKTVTGTTNANGNLSLALSPSTYTVFSVTRTDDNNTICIPFQGGSNWYARCLQANTTNHVARASTSVTLRVTYANTAALIGAL